MDTAEAPAEEDDIQVKTMDVGQYNTINLQEELAEGLKEVLGNRQDKSAEVTRAIMEPMYNSDTESLDFPEIGEVDAEDLEPEKEQVESSEVFFGETGDLSSLYGTENGGEPALKELTAPEPDSTEAESSSQQAAVPTGEENREEEKPVQEKGRGYNGGSCDGGDAQRKSGKYPASGASCKGAFSGIGRTDSPCGAGERKH